MKKKPPTISIKELSQNPSIYVGKNISIKGRLNDRGKSYSLGDNQGYWVWIGENCIEKQRDYNYDSKIYYAKGEWLSPQKCDYSTIEAIIRCQKSIKSNYRLSCITHLS